MKSRAAVSTALKYMSARLAGRVPRARNVRWLLATAVLAAAVGCMAGESRTGAEAAAPASGMGIPAGYREWTLISVAREEGELDDIRAILGNEVALEAYRAGKLPFPDGSILARLAWSHDPSEENNRAFGREQSFVAGAPKNGVQFMVKDAKRFASTGGWGFAHFDDGQPAGEAVLKACFDCHRALPERDLVFTRYSP